jgi:uncharacterized OB-fold protein
MSEEKQKKVAPAIEGWFTMEGEPRLLGTKCTSCGTYFFPKEEFFCRNPDCAGREFEEVKLSGRGKVWSFTNAGYQPPPPYVAADPFEPFAIAAVQLEKEKMVVLGQVVPGVDFESLSVGMEMELVLGTLFEDDEASYQTWRWKPVAS